MFVLLLISLYVLNICIHVIIMLCFVCLSCCSYDDLCVYACDVVVMLLVVCLCVSFFCVVSVCVACVNMCFLFIV